MYDRTSLRKAAAAKGHYTYEALAKHVGVSPATAWRLWYGKVAPSAGVAHLVELAYGVTLAQLLQRKAAA
ncbi:XRE family transcriptional regulator [Streptomyces erythrochromogenes]|uniref:XRE family transcriptional regulator n=1 Tax=Streptomyces erythrochromogenes TaxID=285574 RepID=UPI0036A20E54